MRLFCAEVAPLLQGGAAASALARALLRHAVETTWGIPCPPVAADAQGKPYFVGAPERHLSLSHSASHILVGLSEHPLGVDIETRRPISAALRRRLLDETERAQFDFFEVWTLRESIFKLTNEGWLLDQPLRRSADGAILARDAGIRLRLYPDAAGCMAAAACRAGEFPPALEFVPPEAFWP